jgi:hypothetical protein
MVPLDPRFDNCKNISWKFRKWLSLHNVVCMDTSGKMIFPIFYGKSKRKGDGLMIIHDISSFDGVNIVDVYVVLPCELSKSNSIFRCRATLWAI